MSSETGGHALSANETLLWNAIKAQLLNGIPVHVSTQGAVINTIKKIKKLGMIRLRTCKVHRMCLIINPTVIALSPKGRSEFSKEFEGYSDKDIKDDGC